MDYYDLIQAYVDNTLTQEQRVAFEAEMARDPELRLTVDQFPTILDAVNAAAQDDARKLVSEIREKVKQQTPLRIRQLIPRQLQIAAGILLIIVAGVVIYSNISYSTPAMVRTAYEAPSDLGVFQSDGAKDERWDAVMTAWEGGEREQALELAEVFLAEHKNNADAIRRVAYLYFQAGKYSRSLGLLESLRGSRQYADYADFHYALTLLQLHREAEATALLDSIAGVRDHRYHQEADQMRSRLSSPLHRLAFQ